MPNGELGQEKLAKSVPQNELTLAVLREQALELLLLEGKSSSFQSTARRTNQGLEVDTTNEADRSKSKLVINGTSTYEPPLHGWHLDTEWKGEYTIAKTRGGRQTVEKSSFDYSGSLFDDIMSRQDRANVSMTRRTSDGKTFQSYIPAISQEVVRKGQVVRDSNDQPLRVAREADGANNCGLDYSRSSRGTQDCNYLIRDSRFGKDISYNETHDKTASGFYYRSVLRDRQGTVLGIMEQSFDIDGNGDLTNVQTSARKPVQIKKN